MTNLRVGHGYDVHRLVPGRKLVLGGVEIPWETGLLGHSDADVLVHAVIDALTGAARLGDIGKLFPDTDPAYKGISSLKLLEETGHLLEEKGFAVVNIDASLLAQAPKVAPYKARMAENIAVALRIVGTGQRQGHHRGGAGLHRRRLRHGGPRCGISGTPPCLNASNCVFRSALRRGVFTLWHLSLPAP